MNQCKKCGSRLFVDDACSNCGTESITILHTDWKLMIDMIKTLNDRVDALEVQLNKKD